MMLVAQPPTSSSNAGSSRIGSKSESCSAISRQPSHRSIASRRSRRRRPTDPRGSRSTPPCSGGTPGQGGASTSSRALRPLRPRTCRLVQGSNRLPELGRVPLDRVGQLDPVMTAMVVARLRRRRERGIGERADRDDDQIRLRRLRVEDLRPALGTEMEGVLLASASSEIREKSLKRPSTRTWSALNAACIPKALPVRR